MKSLWDSEQGKDTPSQDFPSSSVDQANETYGVERE